MSTARDPKYSWVFQELTKNDNGQIKLDSAIACTIYKKQKIEFIDRIKAAHHRDPNDSEWQVFHMSNELPAALQGFKDQAAHVVADLLNVALSQEIARLEDQALLESRVATELQMIKQTATANQAIAVQKLDTLEGYFQQRQGPKWWFSEASKNLLVSVVTVFIFGGAATVLFNFNKIVDWFKG